MINYSIVMRSVNANLLEINQAKSRINQAKKEGKTPDPKDLELVKTEKQNAFAISQYTDIMTIEKFAKHITSHGSVYSRADISAILFRSWSFPVIIIFRLEYRWLNPSRGHRLMESHLHQTTSSTCPEPLLLHLLKPHPKLS